MVLYAVPQYRLFMMLFFYDRRPIPTPLFYPATTRAVVPPPAFDLVYDASSFRLDNNPSPRYAFFRQVRTFRQFL